MSKKKTLTIGLTIIAVCLLICVVYGVMNRSEKRGPTQQEMEAYAPYAINWQEATGLEGTEKEIILSLCTFAEEKTIGQNLYQIYTSDTLGGYLYGFTEMNQIAELDGAVYVQYYAQDGDMVTLNYSDAGLTELGVYDAETDTFYHDLNGTVEVWTNFRSGIQWGA